MSERLIIDNFAGIKHLDLEIGKITVLIGPQATGKSICAKLLHFFYGFTDSLSLALVREQSRQEFESSVLEKFRGYFPNRNLGSGRFSVRYEVFKEGCASVFIEVWRGQGHCALAYSDELYDGLERAKAKSLSNGPDGQNSSALTLGRTLARMVVADILRERLVENLGYDTRFENVFIPAGRSFFAFLDRNIYGVIQSSSRIDRIMAEFGQFYKDFKSEYGGGRDMQPGGLPVAEGIDGITREILRGYHVMEDDEDFLVTEDGRRVNVANASSGQQEALPLTVILRSLTSPGIDAKGYHIFIEEPEAHLFPTAQKRIVELMAIAFNSPNFPKRFFITTHSPYILTSLNNLIEAGSLSKSLTDEGKLAKLKEIVPLEQWLNIEDLRVYSLFGGTGESIIDEETKLISGNVIDEVSNELSVQFGQLLDLEY